jgi:hypothetical protein
MNFSGIGGLTIAVVAVLWIFIFIPSWFNSSAERREESAVNKVAKEAVQEARRPILTAPKTKAGSLSDQIHRAHTLKRSFVFLTWMFGSSAVALGFMVQEFGFLLPISIVAGLLAAVGLRASVMAVAAEKRLLVGSIRSRSASASLAYSANAKAQIAAKAQALASARALASAQVRALEEQRAAEIAARAFTVKPIPVPTYVGQLGSLETPELASVVEMPGLAEVAKPQPVDGETIIEIMRRRRVNGL